MPNAAEITEVAQEIAPVALEHNALQAFSYRILAPVLVPLNNLLDGMPDWFGTVAGMGLFLVAMLWVGVLLKQDYVNGGRPNKSVLTDLRIWTCLAMLPHVVVYLYFR